MSATATALVQTGPTDTEFQEIPLPRLIPGSALLRVEANGICASDIDAFEGHGGGFDPADMSQYPRINGHEIVGVIEDVGPGVAGRKDLRVGDRVAVNPWLSCGNCDACRRSQPQFCQGMPWVRSCYGFIPTTIGAGLWGGYSTHVYIDPNAILYTFPNEVSALDAALWNPLASGIQWAVKDAGVTLGSKVAVLGSGQRGLACVAAAKAAGAGAILATGLSRDAHKLALATRLGADVVVDVEADDVVSRGAELTGGSGFDIVIDTSPGAEQPILDAIRMLRTGGTLASAGIKGRPLTQFPIDAVTTKGIRMIGVLGTSHEAQQMAADLVISGSLPLHELRTHTFGFDQVPLALEVLQGRVEGENAINIVVEPEFRAAS